MNRSLAFLAAAALTGAVSCADLQQPTAPVDSVGASAGSAGVNPTVVKEAVSLDRKYATYPADAPEAVRSLALSGSGAGALSHAEYEVSSIPFVPVAGPLNNVGPICDDCVMNDVPIGFPFTFFGNSYTTLQISSNGFVRFAPPNNDNGCCSGRPIPLDDTWNNIIALAWADWQPSPQTSISMRFDTRGVAPHRRFILQIDDMQRFNDPNTRLKQWLILYETTSIIEIHTEQMNAASGVFTQGIENEDGTVAYALPGRVATLFTLANDAVRFTPPSADLMISQSVDKTRVKQGELLTYYVRVQNLGPGTARDVVVNDVLPSGATFVEARARNDKGTFTAPPAGETGTVTWYLGDMLNGDDEVAEIAVTVLVRGKTTITNTAAVTGSSADPNLANNTSAITVSVAPGSSGGGNGNGPRK